MEIIILVIFGIGLLCLLAWEIGQWRRAEGVLSPRQRRMRVMVIALLALVLALMGASMFGAFRTALEQAVALTAMLCLAVLVFLLALLDFRELRGRKQEREMRAYGEMMRFLSGAARAKKAAGRTGYDEDGGNGRSKDL